jgi:hypothetical protein
MLNTKYVLMFAVLSAGMLTALTATGVSQAQTAFADDNDNEQKINQENNCKIVNKNEHGDDSVRDNDNDLTCQNLAQNPNKAGASISGDPFSGSD